MTNLLFLTQKERQNEGGVALPERGSADATGIEYTTKQEWSGDLAGGGSTGALVLPDTSGNNVVYIEADDHFTCLIENGANSMTITVEKNGDGKAIQVFHKGIKQLTLTAYAADPLHYRVKAVKPLV